MKNLFKVISILLLSIILTGCNEVNNSDDPLLNNNNNAAASGSLESFVAQIRGSITELSTDTYSADLIARNNSLVYVYTYKKVYTQEEVDLMKPLLESGTKENPTPFTSLLSSVRTLAPSTKSVIVEYYNGDNTLISSIEFE